MSLAFLSIHVGVTFDNTMFVHCRGQEAGDPSIYRHDIL